MRRSILFVSALVLLTGSHATAGGWAQSDHQPSCDLVEARAMARMNSCELNAFIQQRLQSMAQQDLAIYNRGLYGTKIAGRPFVPTNLPSAPLPGR